MYGGMNGKYFQSPLGAAPTYRKRAPIQCEYVHSYTYTDDSAAIKRYLHHVMARALERLRYHLESSPGVPEFVAFGACLWIGELYNKIPRHIYSIKQLNRRV